MRLLAAFQGAYFLLTGIWPLLSIASFQAVTGRKTDLWLVKTVGVLIIVIGLVLLLAAWRATFSAEVIFLAVGSAVGLMGIDITYVTRRVISPIYLLDAVLKIGLLLLWGIAVVA